MAKDQRGSQRVGEAYRPRFAVVAGISAMSTSLRLWKNDRMAEAMEAM